MGSQAGYADDGHRTAAHSFLLEDHNMVKSEFLESINSLLSCGDVPGIWTPDEPGASVGTTQGGVGRVSRSRCCSFSDSFRVFRPPGTQPHAYCVVHGCEPPSFPHFLRREPQLFSCCNVMWLDDWRQLTDVSDCNKNNLQQLLTSIHKSQLMHGASPRDFVTLLQTYKAIYKVETNVMEGIFFHLKVVVALASIVSTPAQERHIRSLAAGVATAQAPFR